MAIQPIVQMQRHPRSARLRLMSLRYAILGLLMQDDLSGYELTRRFDQSVGYFWHARSQQIYPELARLEEDGCVSSWVVEQIGRPDKRLHSITERGREALRAWVVSPSPVTLVKDEFLVKVWSYGHVDPEAAIRAVAQQGTHHEERLATYRTIESSIGPDTHALGDDARFGAYLTLLGGIAIEEALVGWCRQTEALFRRRETERLAAARAAAGS